MYSAETQLNGSELRDRSGFLKGSINLPMNSASTGSSSCIGPVIVCPELRVGNCKFLAVHGRPVSPCTVDTTPFLSHYLPDTIHRSIWGQVRFLFGPPLCSHGPWLTLSSTKIA